ncbi:MAG: hypothetical protein LUG93_04210, partial [Lachnospiraceae bacterium]|nr:hypothetical protein [Lachnospiraceae bacterium]
LPAFMLQFQKPKKNIYTLFAVFYQAVSFLMELRKQPDRRETSSPLSGVLDLLRKSEHTPREPGALP